MEDNLQWKKTSTKVQYLSNHWSDLPQIGNISSGDQTKIKMLEMKMTSNRRQPQNNKSWISQQTLIGSSSNFKSKLMGPKQNQNPWNEYDLQWKKTSKIKSWISQQPLIGSFSNLKHKFRGPNQNKKCLKWGQPPMEDDLKILTVEYLSNRWSDLPQILNLGLGDPIQIDDS
jgi:hypothetical protein